MAGPTSPFQRRSFTTGRAATKAFQKKYKAARASGKSTSEAAKQAAIEKEEELAAQREKKIEYKSERQKRIAETFQKQGYNVSVDTRGEIVATKGGRQVLVGEGDKVVEAPSTARVQLRSTPTREEQKTASFIEQERRSGGKITAKPIIEKGRAVGLSYASEKAKEEGEAQKKDFFERPYGEAQRKTISKLKSEQKARRSFQKRVDVSLEKGESTVDFFKREGYQISREEPYLSRLKKTGANLLLLTGRGFGEVAKTTREKPVESALVLGGIAIGTGILARGATLATGVSLPAAKGYIGLGLLGGFSAYKEYKQPGAVTTLPGAISTTTEFGTYSVGVRGISTAAKSARLISPKYIPFAKTTQESTPVEATAELIPQFQGATRRGTAIQQAKPVGKGDQFLFSTTATQPRKFFGIFSKTKAEFGKAKFEVIEPPKAEIGGERAKFGETYFYFSQGEAYTIFGEQAASRLGTVPRGSGPFGLITTAPKRFSELFLRGQNSIILRAKEEVSGFSSITGSSIKKGETGTSLRRRINVEIKEQPGKIFPGPKTSSEGFGEIEYVAPVDTQIYRLSGEKRITYSPSAQKFQEVVDIGLKPGERFSGEYNVKGRLANIKDITLEEVFGVSGTKATKFEAPKEAKKQDIFIRSRTRTTAREGIIRRPIRTRTRERIVEPRVRTRERATTPRIRTRERRIDERVRTRTREIIPRVRTRTREQRIRERERLIEPRTRQRLRETRQRFRIRASPKIISEETRSRLFLFNQKPTKAKKKKADIFVPFGRKYQPQIRSAGEEIYGKAPRLLTGIGFERPL